MYIKQLQYLYFPQLLILLILTRSTLCHSITLVAWGTHTHHAPEWHRVYHSTFSILPTGLSATKVLTTAIYAAQSHITVLVITT